MHRRPPDHLLRLADVRIRIELFLTALFERPLAIVAADAAAPGSWLARLAGRGPDERGGIFAGTDGVRIYLPPTVDASGGVTDAVQWYLLIAVEQAARLVRGSAAVALAIVDGEVRDRFLLADAVAVDDWIVRQAPGLTPALRTARQSALAQRTRARRSPGRSQSIEARVREFLAQDPGERFAAVPMCVTSSGALEWACTVSGRGLFRARFAWTSARRLLGAPAASAQRNRRRAVCGSRRRVLSCIPRRRVAEMRRRPRVREAGEDEDDQGTGMWIIRPDEPQESVEDPFGLQRPADRADEADPEGLGDSLAELPEARVVRTPGQAREILRAGDDLPTAAGHAAAALATSRPRLSRMGLPLRGRTGGRVRSCAREHPRSAILCG